MPAIPRRARTTRPRLRRRDGDDALRARRVPQPILRRAEPDAAGPGRRSAPVLRPRRRRRDRDQHVRRQPHQALDLRPGGPHRGDQRAGGAARPRAPRASRPTWPGRSAARRPHRAVGQDRRGRGGIVFRRAGGGAPRGRRRPVRARDVSRSQRDWRRDSRGPGPVRAADRRAGHDRRRREHTRRRCARAVRAAARAAGRRRGRPELQRRPGRDAGDDRAYGQGGHGAAVGAAQRRAAA